MGMSECVSVLHNDIYLIAPGKQDNFKIGFVAGRRHFEDDGLDDNGAVGKVLHAVTSEHANKA